MTERKCDKCGDLVSSRGWSAHRRSHRLTEHQENRDLAERLTREREGERLYAMVCPIHGEWVDNGTTDDCPECIAARAAKL